MKCHFIDNGVRTKLNRIFPGVSGIPIIHGNQIKCTAIPENNLTSYESGNWKLNIVAFRNGDGKIISKDKELFVNKINIVTIFTDIYDGIRRNTVF